MTKNETLTADRVIVMPCNNRGACHVGDDGDMMPGGPRYYHIVDHGRFTMLYLANDLRPLDQYDVEEGTWSSVEAWLEEIGWTEYRPYKVGHDLIDWSDRTLVRPM